MLLDKNNQYLLLKIWNVCINKKTFCKTNKKIKLKTLKVDIIFNSLQVILKLFIIYEITSYIKKNF